MTTYGIDRSVAAGGAGGPTTALLADGSQPLTDDWDTGQYGILVGGKLALTNIISPAAISATTNNWAPTGFSEAAIIRLNASATSTITGLAGGSAGRTVFIHNISGYEITFEAESVSSTAANRFALTNDITIQDNEVAVLQYDGTESRWRIVVSSSGGTSVAATNIVTRNYTGDGTTAVFALGATPTGESVVFVFLDGVFQNNTEWTILGSDLTFSTAPANGVAIETRVCDVLTIGTPSDNTVATAKLQDNAVTYAKLSTDVQGSMWSFKNAVMNGAFEIWQRGTSGFTTSAAYTADRWAFGNTSAATFTISRSTDVPTVAEAGSLTPYSLYVDCTGADSSIAAGDLAWLYQPIEGYIWRRFAQRALTLSFWVKATKTGTYCASLRNSGVDRSYVAEYTVNASNTWERKTITFSASPSAGTWDYTTGIGATLAFCILSGSTYQTTANAWQTGNYLATSNQVNGFDSTSNDFRIARVQLEVGSTATNFEDIPQEVELVRCFRYYERGDASNYALTFDFSTPGGINVYQCLWVPYKARKRANTTASVANVTWGTISGISATYPKWIAGDVNGFLVQAETTSGAATRAYAYSTVGYWENNAEL